MIPRVRNGSTVETIIDSDVLDELFVLREVGGANFLTSLVDQFVRETDAHLVELRAASDVGDASAVGRIAHTIRGSGSQLGGRRLALSCGRLEDKATTRSLSDAEAEMQDVESDYQDLRRALTQQMSSLDPMAPAVSL